MRENKLAVIVLPHTGYGNEFEEARIPTQVDRHDQLQLCIHCKNLFKGNYYSYRTPQTCQATESESKSLLTTGTLHETFQHVSLSN